MPSLQLKVETRVVDLWRVALGAGAPYEYLLSADERERARSYHREKDARRFVHARAALRQILARYVQSAPQDIVFAYNACGKPFVENSEWQFNLSHCEDVALIAVAKNRAVGVDIERVDETRALRMKSLLSPEDVENNFSAREVCMRWVQMESLVKARGEGLSIPLPPIRVLESGYAVSGLDLQDNFVGSLSMLGAMPVDICWHDYAELLS